METHILESALYKAMILHTFFGTAKMIYKKNILRPCLHGVGDPALVG